MRSSTLTDAQAAVGLYALIGVLLCISWLVFFAYLSRHSELVAEDVKDGFFQRECARALAGIVLYAVAGVLGILFTPLVGLVIFFGLTVFYALTSHGLTALPSPRRRATVG